MFHDTDTNHLVLMTNHIGFRVNWLRQFCIRNFRMAATFQGEASSILHTWPSVQVSNEDNVRKVLLNAVTMHLLWEEGRFGILDLDKPLPDIDPEFGAPNCGFHTLFDAWRDDRGLGHSLMQRDVVADGNQVLTRKLCSDEVSLKKRGRGRLSKRPISQDVPGAPPYTSPSSTRRKRPNTPTTPRASLRRLICELRRYCTSERCSMPSVDLTWKIRGP